MALVKCHECGRDVSTEAAACQNCGAPVVVVINKESAGPPPNYAMRGVAVALALGALFYWFAARPIAKEQTQQSPNRPPWVLLRQEVDRLRPDMADMKNSVNWPVVDLAEWSARYLTWGQMDAFQTTSYGLVMKDSDGERGKLICVTGRVVEIAVDKVRDQKVTTGGLRDVSGQIYRFINVGGSGEILERSIASMCGVVTGRYDYSNSGGGTTHSLLLVGMFDLPENRGPH